MLIDSHIHVGQFNNIYFSPTAIIKLMTDVGVGYYAVSSTTSCEEDFEKVLHEIEELEWNDAERVLPIMWITPESLKGNIAWLLESTIKWRCLKIHPFLHKKEWKPDGKLFNEVLDIARELKIPLLIHTGNEECCQIDIYENAVTTNEDIIFIFAHGRPTEQAIPITQKHNNAYVDSAFMPVNDMKKFIDVGLSHKLLWGTDMCIPKYFYPEEDMVEYYRKKLEAFKSICNESQFKEVTCSNAQKLFNIETNQSQL